MKLQRTHILPLILTIALLLLNRAWGAEADGGLPTPYTGMLNELRTDLAAKVPTSENEQEVNKFLASNALDAKLAKYVVLTEATPKGLAEFAQQGKEQEALVERLLGDAELMQQMLVADGAKDGQYGPAMKIYSDIRRASQKADKGVLQRLALAISLVHAVPMAQGNPQADIDAPKTIDPVKRYAQFEKAYLGGELDQDFERQDTWNLRFVVDGDEPDWTLVWGREMLRNYRPDHIYNSDPGWRYVGLVSSDVRYGSGDVKYDRPELQNYQNILMNGGICGRRAFFGRFILRAFGVPTTARPQSGHGALVHCTPNGWVPCLGGGWGSGWTATVYKNDLDFLASTQARSNRDAYLKVKRAQWIGDVLEEKRVYGEHGEKPAFWNGVSLRTQRAIIEQSKVLTLAALGTELGEANGPTVAKKVLAEPVSPEDKKIGYGKNGVIAIPATAYSKPVGNTGDVVAMKSFGGGMQIFLPRFSTEGLTILRGGAWRTDITKTGSRMQSAGYGKYNNWGFRVAVTPADINPPATLKLDLGEGVNLELVYIQPGTFVMGGESAKEGRFECVDMPKHEVTLTKGFYLGKYEVTQAQYQLIMGSNPSGATKDPSCPVDTIGETDATEFCAKVVEKTGQEVRLPTEAEWEYACRAGTKTEWFFGDDPSKFGDYAWFRDNDGGKSHPVGQKKPNPWGLYDIYGNVYERVSDRYAKDYYAKSPKEDPTGPSLGQKSRFEYEIDAPQAGKYALTAQVVTANYNQRLDVSVNDAASDIAMEMPYTCGQWQDCQPVTLMLRQGKNVLRFSRTNPPQYGVAIKSFTLSPAR
ncbi:Formylglycine-generating sulfatase enzyme [Anatilimnocola aggregata]|uniref:Formylglycine-generating sulfatase enzyme n=1 Tax=Anatilimnocola aggregata TaxID=2528021 RepID=A0A517Y8Q1_9BACT|nr:SUMF1/EgtB/PvdO family nonheme iron enzyme [Anatilimnocola aggregata]QDU26581.1 Formylglycine-generating sulfatase enzyme [Anatilimnocola aggregata]